MPRSGDKLGPYTLIRKLGKGGFGEVWLVEEHEAILSSQFALKILLDDDTDIDEVKQEAFVWLQASGHFNVLPIHKAATYDGQLVIVSEFAPDGSLKDWLKKHNGKAPSIKEAVQITDGILAGLEHLHERRIIHRDIKPANILMQGNTPRLADFGISRILKSTVHSQIQAGTPQYMSPEAFRGERDEQTDIWAVGVLLYRLVSGRLPFPETDVYVLMDRIANTEPPPLGADVPIPLQKIINKALEKQKTMRYQSANEMRRALQEAQRQIEQEERQQRQIEDQKRIEGQKRQQFENQKKQLTVERDVEATIIREPKLVKFEQQKPEKIEFPKRPSVIPNELQTSPLVKSKRLWWLIGGVVLMGMIVLVAMIFNNKSGNTNSSTRPPSEIIRQIESQMVQIKGGTFMMGSSASIAEEPPHQVTVSSFYMSKYEVTQEQWRAVASLPKVNMDLNVAPSSFKGDNLPVERVSWEDVIEFCARLSKETGKTYRLPTEAEWEYACRAGTTGAYAGDLNSMAWYKGTSDSTTHLVGTKLSNKFGLYDMHGNVWEWCQDWYSESYYAQSPIVNPMGPTTGSYRVGRGGGWDDGERVLWSSARVGGVSTEHFVFVGFRLVKTYP
jgi:formylglycine-generating enzyme required for sulfatase activity